MEYDDPQCEVKATIKALDTTPQKFTNSRISYHIPVDTKWQNIIYYISKNIKVQEIESVNII